MAKITRGEFRKRSHHSLNVNIRLRTRGMKPTKANVEEVLETILDRGRVPKGWEFAMIRWTHSRTGTTGWRRGTIQDLHGQFELVIPDLLENLRIGVDRAKSGGDVWEIEIALEY